MAPEPGTKPEAFGEDYFSQNYGGSSGSYQARATPNKWRSMCHFISRHVPDMREAADVGCADGSFLRYATRQFPNVRWSGSDVSRYGLGLARASMPTVDLRECPVTALGFGDEAFDCVTAFDVLEHIPDLEAAVGEIARVLRPGGHLIASVPVYDGPVGWLVRLLDRDPTHVHKLGRQAWLEEPLARRFDLREWHGAWRYFVAGRYWHVRSPVGRSAAPAIVMAWKKR